jgi:hypothetical protein
LNVVREGKEDFVLGESGGARARPTPPARKGRGGERGFTNSASDRSRGTEGSNPSPSSKESSANLFPDRRWPCSPSLGKYRRGSWNEELFRVLEGFPELAHDDEVDACSGALEMLNPQMKGWGIYELYMQKARRSGVPLYGRLVGRRPSRRDADGRSAGCGGLAISGLFDLEPIRLSYLDEMLGLDPEEARRNSPLLNLPVRAAKFIIAYGSDELPELKRQSREFGAAWSARGLPGR